MSVNWAQAAQQGLSVLTTTGVAGLIGKGVFDRIKSKQRAVEGREKRRAEAADVLTDTALTLVEPLKRELAEVRAEATDLRLQVHKAVTEAESAIHELRRLKLAILDPASTLGALRDLVSRHGRNGMP